MRLLPHRLLPSGAKVVASLLVVNFPEWIAPISRDEQVIGRGEEAKIRRPDRFRTVSR